MCNHETIRIFKEDHTPNMELCPLQADENGILSGNQRADRKDNAVYHIYHDFNPLLLGVFFLSRRIDGKLIILDGGGRFVVIMKLIQEGTLPWDFAICATVFEELTEDEERTKFIELNDWRQGVSAGMIWNNRAANQGTLESRILTMLRDEFHVMVGTKRAVPAGFQHANVSSAITKVKKLAGDQTIEVLRASILFLNTAFPGQQVWDNRVVMAAGEMFEDNPKWRTQVELLAAKFTNKVTLQMCFAHANFYSNGSYGNTVKYLRKAFKTVIEDGMLPPTAPSGTWVQN
jgi:hypothetical protein